MVLYLYDCGTRKVLLTMEKVISYTGDQVVTEEGIYGPFAENSELSSLKDCSETLRANWYRDHPSSEARLDELESLMASLLFGGETV